MRHIDAAKRALAISGSVFLVVVPMAACDDDTATSVDTIAPAAVSDLAVTAVTDSSATLVWTAPGDDGDAGRAAAYEVRHSPDPILTEGDFGAATAIAAPGPPAAAGVVEELVIGGLLQKETYHFAVRARDEQGNWSGISNATQAELLPGPFSLRLTVVDDTGAPVEGIAARLYVPIPGVGPDAEAAPRRAATAIQMVLPETALVRLEMLDFHGRSLRLMNLGLLVAGVHQFVYDGFDPDSGHLVGTTVLRCDMTASDPDTGEVLFEDSIHPVYCPFGDVARLPVLGVTDATGTIMETDQTLFPGLYDLPELQLTDADGQAGETFTISNDVDIYLSDGGGWGRYPVSIEDGLNEAVLVWGRPSEQLPPVGIRGAGASQDIPVEPPTEFVLLPNVPNPFN